MLVYDLDLNLLVVFTIYIKYEILGILNEVCNLSLHGYPRVSGSELS